MPFNVIRFLWIVTKNWQLLEIKMEDRWLSVDEIADHLGIKRDTVYKWISEREMPGHKIGRLWKFKKDQVDEWVKSGGGRRTNNNMEET